MGKEKKENTHLKQINPTWFRIVRVFSLVWKLYSKHAFLSCFFPLFFSVFLFFSRFGICYSWHEQDYWMKPCAPEPCHRLRRTSSSLAACKLWHGAHHSREELPHCVQRSFITHTHIHARTHTHALSQSQYGLRWASLFDRVCFRALSHTSHSCSVAFHTAEVPGRIFKHLHELKDTIFDVRVKFGCF